MVDKVFTEILKYLLNPSLLKIGMISSACYSNRTIIIKMFLNGIEDKEIEIACRNISISDDYRSITFCDFSSNMPFAENALNMFAARTYKLPDSTALQASLRVVKAILGL